MKIGLLSDTHGYIGKRSIHVLETCDEIWHAGICTMDVLAAGIDRSCSCGVWGDDDRIRAALPEDQIFQLNGLKVVMTHIGGYPSRYNSRARGLILSQQPDLFILRTLTYSEGDEGPEDRHLHMNPELPVIMAFMRFAPCSHLTS